MSRTTFWCGKKANWECPDYSINADWLYKWYWKWRQGVPLISNNCLSLHLNSMTQWRHKNQYQNPLFPTLFSQKTPRGIICQMAVFVQDAGIIPVFLSPAKRKTPKQGIVISVPDTWTTSWWPCGWAWTRWRTSIQTFHHTTIVCGTPSRLLILMAWIR